MPAVISWKSYQQVAAQTAPPGQLILMLFDGALLSLERALIGFACIDPAERNQTIHNNLRRALDIIRELNNSLNLEAGGQLAETLRNLYTYFDQRIMDSNWQKHRDGVDEVIGRLKELRDAWATMLAYQGMEQSLPTELKAQAAVEALSAGRPA
jgi:flagellar secretion chaperone FliS